METKFLISFIIGILNIFLGIVIYNKNRQSLNNIFYGLMCFAGGMWGIFMSFLWITKDENLVNNFVVRGMYLFAILAPLFYLLFAYNFPLKSFIYSRKVLNFIVAIPIILIILILTSVLTMESITFSGDSVNSEFIASNFIFFVIYFFAYIIWGLAILLKKVGKDVFRSHKKAITYLIIGTISTFFLTGIVSVIMPLLGNSQYDWLGPIFLLVHFVVVGYLIFFEFRKY